MEEMGQVDFFPLFTDEAGNQVSKAHKLNWRSQRWWWQTMHDRTAGGLLQLPTLGPVVPRGTQASSFFVLTCPVLKRRHSLLAAAVTSSCIFSTVVLWTNYILAKGTARNWQGQAFGKAQYRQWANLRQEAEFSGSSAKWGKETELNSRMVSLFPSCLGGTRSAV